MASKLSKKQIQEINKLRSQFPNPIRVEITRPTEGGFLADVKTFPSVFTEADSFSELIEMVNDAVRTYFEIPKKYLEFMPTYLPQLEVAKRLDVFPVKERQTNIKLEILDGSAVAR